MKNTTVVKVLAMFVLAGMFVGLAAFAPVQSVQKKNVEITGVNPIVGVYVGSLSDGRTFRAIPIDKDAPGLVKGPAQVIGLVIYQADANGDFWGYDAKIFAAKKKVVKK